MCFLGGGIGILDLFTTCTLRLIALLYVFLYVFLIEEGLQLQSEIPFTPFLIDCVVYHLSSSPLMYFGTTTLSCTLAYSPIFFLFISTHLQSLSKVETLYIT